MQFLIQLFDGRIKGKSGQQVPSDLNVCLVLGAKLRPDNSLSPILKLRVKLVSILANTYPDWIFYISGCRDDTTVIYRTLVEDYLISEDRFVIDCYGRNTFHSMLNMKRDFQQSRFYILTSSFHIGRCLRIARWLGIKAWGIDISNYEKVKKNPYLWRERLAMVKSLMLSMLVRMQMDKLEKWFITQSRRWHRYLGERHLDERNRQIMEQALASVDETIPLTEHFFLQMKLNLPFIPWSFDEKEHFVVNLCSVDCTTVIENVLALALCYRDNRRTYADLTDYYRRIHYKDGIISFATRNHYFTWMMESAIKEGFVERIGPDEPAFPFTGLMDIRPSYMTLNKHLIDQMAHEENYRAIEARQQEGVRYTYIPRELLNMPQDSELGVICDGDILAVTCDQHTWARGLETKHLLLAKWIDGRLHYYHATVGYVGLGKEDVYTYLQNKFTMIGVAVYRFKYNKA